jgi:hypothetical protein
VTGDQRPPCHRLTSSRLQPRGGPRQSSTWNIFVRAALVLCPRRAPALLGSARPGTCLERRRHHQVIPFLWPIAGGVQRRPQERCCSHASMSTQQRQVEDLSKTSHSCLSDMMLNMNMSMHDDETAIGHRALRNRPPRGCRATLSLYPGFGQLLQQVLFAMDTHMWDMSNHLRQLWSEAFLLRHFARHRCRVAHSPRHGMQTTLLCGARPLAVHFARARQVAARQAADESNEARQPSRARS